MKTYSIALAALMTCAVSYANSMSTTVYTTDSKHTRLGSIQFKDTPKGLLITPALSGLSAGAHGFHIHEHGNCADAGMAAGGHFDPKKTNSHQGPVGNGHEGDMPILEVSADGTASKSMLAPHLKSDDIRGLSIIIHAGGDNYSNQPPLGGGGARIACGVIEP